MNFRTLFTPDLPGGGSAPANAHYVTTQSESGLSNEFSLGTLSTGLLKVTVSASVGTPSTAVVDTDYMQPIHNDTAKTTPVDADEFVEADSAASFVAKKVTWSNIKATLKTYFDTIYATVALESLDADIATTNSSTIPAGTYTAQTYLATLTGAVTIDGRTLALGDRVLDKDNATAANRGLWTVTVAGALGVALAMTRTQGMNQANEFYGALVIVLNGTANAGTFWKETAVVTTVGSDPVTFSQLTLNVAVTSVFGRTGAVVAANDDYSVGQLQSVSNNTILSNISGGSARPSANAISSFQGTSSTTFAAGNDSRFTDAAKRTYSGTTDTLVLADAGQVVASTGGSAATETIPTHASVAFDVGCVIQVLQYGAGQVTISGAGGVTVRIPNGGKTAGQYKFVTLYQYAQDEWIVGGDSTT